MLRNSAHISFLHPFLHSGFQSTPELLEIFQTEFSLRLFWGSKGAQAERGERYKKFERILTVLSQKLEWAHGRSIPPTPCLASWNARHGWQRWLVSSKEESHPVSGRDVDWAEIWRPSKEWMSRRNSSVVDIPARSTGPGLRKAAIWKHF